MLKYTFPNPDNTVLLCETVLVSLTPYITTLLQLTQSIFVFTVNTTYFAIPQNAPLDKRAWFFFYLNTTLLSTDLSP